MVMGGLGGGDGKISAWAENPVDTHIRFEYMASIVRHI